MSPAEAFRTHQRQVHLDFHTSPHIPGIGSEFDADAFADTFARAHVNSVTVFAKCHHGMCYYPTKTGTVHPGLKAGRDLLGEQIEALHKRGIRAPIYTTVVWEEDVARRYLEAFEMPEGGEVEMPGDDEAEALPATLDLSVVMEEALALALPLYPRAEGAGPADAQVAEPGAAPLTDADVKPFAGLRALRDRMRDGDGS